MDVCFTSLVGSAAGGVLNTHINRCMSNIYISIHTRMELPASSTALTDEAHGYFSLLVIKKSLPLGGSWI